jgi:C-terminal processing protease CtpA/Prc
MTRRLLALWLLGLFVVGSAKAPVRAAQTASKYDRDAGHLILRNIKDCLKKNYYDPQFHGVNIDDIFKAADASIDGATSNGQIFGIIEKALLSLNDTHTFFLPPPHALRVSYDWHIQIVGDRCYVLAVKPATDAEAKGLKAGDIVDVVDGYKLTRDNFWLFNYLYQVLQPRPQLNVVVESPGEQPRRVEYSASTRQGKKELDFMSGTDIADLVRDAEASERVYEHRIKEYGDALYVWNMPQFDLAPDRVNDIVGKAAGHRAMILDLRGNPGGRVDTLLQLVGDVFDHDVTLGERKRRKDSKPLVAKTRGRNAFSGTLVVLIDSGSASCSELFARTVQLEKRGTVIGDHSAGAVMESLRYRFSVGENSLIAFGASVTDADIVMPDGKSLEHVGVTPDEMLLPTGADLREHADPVLSRAALLADVKLSPKQAGELFPPRWALRP